jgi:hypothetical protein
MVHLVRSRLETLQLNFMVTYFKGFSESVSENSMSFPMTVSAVTDDDLHKWTMVLFYFGLL